MNSTYAIPTPEPGRYEKFIEKRGLVNSINMVPSVMQPPATTQLQIQPLAGSSTPWLSAQTKDQFLNTTLCQKNDISKITQSQREARQVMPKTLPKFDGNPLHWPAFISQFIESTKTCGLSNTENLSRLQNSLVGNALKAVETKLLLPDSVPSVLNTLRMLFGRPEMILNTQLRAIRSTPAVEPDRLDSLIQLSLSVQNVCDTMTAACLTNHLNNPVLLQELIDKLPAIIKLEWARYKRKLELVNLSAFNNWLLEIAEAASEVTTTNFYKINEPTEVARSRRFQAKGLNATHAEDEFPTSNKIEIKTCVICKDGSHKIADCLKFQKLSRNDRWKQVKDNKLCRRCLGPHFFNQCKSSRVCDVDGCQFKHHPLLHNSLPKAEPERIHGTLATTSSENYKRSQQKILFRVVPVKLYNKSKVVSTYAFLDEGSSLTLLDEEIANELQLDGPTQELCLKWTSDTTRQEKSSRRVSLTISESYSGSKIYQIFDVRTVAQLKLPVQSLTTESLKTEYEHLRHLPCESYVNAEPRILIGLQHWKLGLPQEVREGQWGEPVAAKTRLGWTVFGQYSEEPSDTHLHMHICDCNVDENLHNEVKQFFSLENFGVRKLEKPLESIKEKRAREILETTTRRVDDRYETGLLWSSDQVAFPDSYQMAKRRLVCLEQKMKRDPVLAANIKTQMIDYVAKGYSRKLSKAEANETGPRTWYLPMFAVKNPNKPDKVRIVWDAAAAVNEISLNSKLLKGPDLLSSLPEILYRFREHRFALCGDIKEMFHRVRIRKEEQMSQRFLWRNCEDNRDPDVYVMCVMTFGATCSPSSAQYVKNLNAKQMETEYPQAAKAINDNHYVDDWLESFETEDQAIQVAKEVMYVHAQGGFEIRNWVSNSNRILENLGQNNTEINKNLNMSNDTKGAKVLGMWWSTTTDSFYYSLNYERMNPEILNGRRCPTKREVLRILMMVYDPLGLLAFFLVKFKILLQEIWLSSVTWDQPITDVQYVKWIRWINILPSLEDIKIPRCYAINDPAEVDDIQIHTFVDASENASAAVSYLRIASSRGIQISLVGGKTKVAPIKPLSIPRMELQAAVLGVRLANSLIKGHSIKITRRIYWTDSVDVLCWLRAEDYRKFKEFVKCRIGEILEMSEVSHWRWVPTKLNVADDATKWKDDNPITYEHRWFTGPEFLYQSEELWPVEKEQPAAPPKEIRNVMIHKESKNLSSLTPNPDRFCSWRHLIRAQAYALRFFFAIKKIKPSKNRLLSQEEEICASKEIYRSVQKEAFQIEIDMLKVNPNWSIPKTSSLYKLSAFLDEEQILRMKGRTLHADVIGYDAKNPIILPKGHPVTFLVVKSFHQRYHHKNQETVVNEVRQQYAISSLRKIVRNVKSVCQRCKNENAVPITPEMGVLPKARLAAFTRPFSYTGLDYFGPIEVSVGRRIEKRYGVLLTCMTTRAIHIEIAHSLTTDSCLMSLRNFIARRGTPLEILSDNGTNFKGANQELNKIKNLQESFTEEFFGVKWTFIPPASPHMGGAWERLVQSVKSNIMSILTTRRPSDELLRSSLTEIENVINSRPLTYMPIDSEHEEALTPNHFLLGSSSGAKPIADFDDNVFIQRKNYKISQKITQLFWHRWVHEYLPTLTRRTKWFQKTKGIEIGDVGVIFDEHRANSWKKGIIIDTVKGSGKQVRSVVVKTSTGTYTRPTAKVAVLDVRQDESNLNS